MVKNKILLIFLAMTFATGCTSFLPIETTNLENIRNHETLIIDFKNGTKLYVNNVKSAKVIDEDKLNIYRYDNTGKSIDSLSQIYSLEEIKSIRTKRFDFGKTFFTIILCVPATALVLALILCNGGCSVGG